MKSFVVRYHDGHVEHMHHVKALGVEHAVRRFLEYQNPDTGDITVHVTDVDASQAYQSWISWRARK